MIKVGLTGGIGSGKSTVAQLFAMLGIAIYDSDARAKELMRQSVDIKARIVALLGEQSYRHGDIDRAYIASRVFTDAGLLHGLNAIVHPAVGEDFEQWALTQSSPYVIMESAILFQSGLDKTIDKTIVVTAPQELRIERVCRRDNVTPEQVLARINNQQPIPSGDFNIISDEKHLLWPQVLKIDKELR